MKRKGISTLFIHSYLWALICLLDHLLLFESMLCGGSLKVFLKMRLRLGKLCNDSCHYKNVYKVLDF